MNNYTLGQIYLKELEMEALATRKCLERIPESLYGYKPHEKSMALGYLVALISEIPKWIAAIVEIGEINFTTWEKYNPLTTSDNLKHFEKNMEKAKKALQGATDETMEKIFYLKSGDKVLMQDPRGESISSTLNHWVHHRGQLSVYMRLNDIAVPSIYGPSADENTF